jgi:hypothetical protein
MQGDWCGFGLMSYEVIMWVETKVWKLLGAIDTRDVCDSCHGTGVSPILSTETTKHLTSRYGAKTMPRALRCTKCNGEGIVYYV